MYAYMANGQKAHDGDLSGGLTWRAVTASLVWTACYSLRDRVVALVGINIPGPEHPYRSTGPDECEGGSRGGNAHR